MISNQDTVWNSEWVKVKMMIFMKLDFTRRILHNRSLYLVAYSWVMKVRGQICRVVGMYVVCKYLPDVSKYLGNM